MRSKWVTDFAIRMLACLALTTGGLAAPSPATATIAQDAAKRKINLAGRQRMLSQRIAMLSCMADTDVLVDQSLAKARAATDLFDRTLTGLRQGSDDQGLAPEDNTGVLEALTIVDRLWLDYGAAVNRYLEGQEEPALRAIHLRNLAILKNMNTAVGIMERTYGEGLISADIAAALNIAGRQRMLIMKALKEACMAGRSFDPQEDRRALARTVSLFESSLYKLRTGNEWDGIVAPPSFEIEMQLELVQMVWDWMRPQLHEIAGGGSAGPEALTRLLYHGEVALREMNAAVWMYEHF